MKSFQILFCEEHHCDDETFTKKVFWRCLRRRTILLAPFLGGFHGDYFAADVELIARAGRAESLAKVREEIEYYFGDLDNLRWLRRRAQVRLSTARLKSLAKQYLPGAGSEVPFGRGASEPRGLS